MSMSLPNVTVPENFSICAGCEDALAVKGSYCASCAMFEGWLEGRRLQAPRKTAGAEIATWEGAGPERMESKAPYRHRCRGLAGAATECDWLRAAAGWLRFFPRFLWFTALLIAVALLTSMLVLFLAR